MAAFTAYLSSFKLSLPKKAGSVLMYTDRSEKEQKACIRKDLYGVNRKVSAICSYVCLNIALKS